MELIERNCLKKRNALNALPWPQLDKWLKLRRRREKPARAVELARVIIACATGPAPIYFDSGYITKKEFCLFGSPSVAAHLLLLLVVEARYLLTIAR